MNRVLDRKFFRLLHTSRAPDGEHQIQEYACTRPESTLVLYSRADEPLAAVTFLPERARTLVTTYRGENRFAALASTDECTYAFALTNLTHMVRSRQRSFLDEGMLKIDLLLDDEPVRAVDLSTRALNQWNEFTPSTTGVVRSDQRRGNHELLLTGVVDARGAALSVAADAATGAPRGTRVRVHVTASTGFPELVEALRDSVWRPAEVIVRAVRVPRAAWDSYRESPPFLPLLAAHGAGDLLDEVAAPHSSAPRAFGASAAGSRNVVLQQGSPFSGDLSLSSSTLLGQSYPYPPPSVSSSSSSSRGDARRMMSTSSSSTMMPAPSAAPFTFGAQAMMMPLSSSSSSSSSLSRERAIPMMMPPLPSSSSSSSSRERAIPMMMPPLPSSSSAAVDVPSTATIDNEAQAARLDVSTRRVLVNTQDTYVEYAYDTPSARAELTLALWRELPAYDTLPDARALTRVLADELAERLRPGAVVASVPADDAMDVARIFVEDTCVVCLEAPPTMLVARCGHQCLCEPCVERMRATVARKCYVCRGRVVSVLRAATLARLVVDA